MRNEKIIANGIVLGFFLGISMFLFMNFSPQSRPLPISGLFLSPIPILVGILVYLTVMGTRKVMDDE